MKAIVVVDQSWAIGKDGGLLVHLPGDLRYFKERTLGCTVIMGRVTLESLPGKKPLPGRKNIVLSSSELCGDFTVCHSLEAVWQELSREADGGAGAFVIGGQRVYEQLLPFCDEVFVTKLAQSFEGADSFFPDLDAAGEWSVEPVAEPACENGVAYQFVVYRRK